METNKHYLMVGSFVLATLCAIAIFSIWIVGVQDSSEYMVYRIHFSESVSGLDVGGPVKFRGVNVGKVKSIVIDPADMRLIRVDISILKTTPIKTNTVAGLKLQGITGSVYVELTGTTPEALSLLTNEYDIPPEIPSQTSALSTIMDILPAILQKISHISEQADKLFNDRNIAAFNDIMENLRSASGNVNQLSHSLKEDPSKILIPQKEKGIPAP